MTTMETGLDEQITLLQLELMKQKLDNERNQPSAPSTPEHNYETSAQTIKLNQAMLRRHRLLDKLKSVNGEDELRRPRSYTGRRLRTSSPMPPPPSRRSLPEGTSSRHSIEHQFRPAHVEPLKDRPSPPSVLQPVMQMPVDQSKHLYKGDFLEMMMLQNAHMHQMMMQQLMLSSVPAPSNNRARPQPSPYADANRRAASFGHHHHNPPVASQSPPAAPPPVVHNYSYLPPIQPRLSPHPSYARGHPWEVEPLKFPRVRHNENRRPSKPRAKSPRSKPLETPVMKPPKKHNPFPGKWTLRLFRHAAYAAVFIEILKKRKRTKPQNEGFLFKIRLKEAVAALHKIYLEPDSKIYPLLWDTVKRTAVQFAPAMEDSKSAEEKNAVEEISYIIENLMFHVTAIMPETGMLGTHRKSAVYDLIQPGRIFPNGYFWQVEKDLLNLDNQNKTTTVKTKEAFLLLVGLFLSRALVTTLLLKPQDYNLAEGNLDAKAEENLKILATILVHITRRVMGPPKGPTMDFPDEMSPFLYSDQEMNVLYNKLKKNITYAEGLLRTWGKEYIERLTAAE